MPPVWVLLSLLALGAWTAQRILSKAALADLGTRKFYLLAAAVSLLIYLPYVILRPPAPSQLPAASGLALLMAVTFGVTTEALRRGPIGSVSPITALGPVVTALLAIAILHERLPASGYAGLACAPLGVALLSRRSETDLETKPASWVWLALLSLVLQGVGAFIAKLVVSPAGPSALLLTSASVQLVVGLRLAPPRCWRREELSGRPALFIVLAYAAGGAATIGYLAGLASGPASAVVPLVSASPALAGALGVVVLRERASGLQAAGIFVALAGVVLLSLSG